jgi:uncharacterized protein
MKSQYSSSQSEGLGTNVAEVRPWWKEPYVWMVIGGPLSAVIACAITAVYILRGPDAVVPEHQYREGLVIKKQVESAAPPLQPAQMGRNHSATGGRQP